MADAQAPEFAPFWRHVAAGRLCFPKCGACGRFHWYPLPRCPHCLAVDIDWCAVEPLGTLFSWTVVRHAFTPAFAEKVPYVVGLIEFRDAPGVRLVSEIRAAPPDALRIAMPVQPVFAGRPAADGLHFIPMASSG